jgi:REP element-mobilizing transposase RayT
MGHSLCKVYVHFVWTTKNRERLLPPSARTRLYEHLFKNARENSILIEALNVQPEHVHMLVNLSRTSAIEELAKLLKGESSHWINHNNVIPEKFSWQTGYGAFSVSYMHFKNVIVYINNQDKHHQRATFLMEYETLLHKYGYANLQTAKSVFED